jgi:hypothetical protein
MPGKEGSMPDSMTRQGLAHWCYARAHPVTWLRWLRVSALAVVFVTALLGWLETSRAHEGITMASMHGVRAVADVADAGQQLAAANSAAGDSFTAGAVALTGPGATYTADIASAAQDLVLAAEDNVAGTAGSDQVQFAEGQLSTYRAQVDQAGTDFAAGDPVLARAELGYATTLLDGLSADLRQLGQGELNAVSAALGSAWLAPGTLWLLLLVPLAVLAAVAAWTCYVLLAGFRRLLSVPLVLAVVTSLAFVIVVAAANAHDSTHAMRFVQLAVGGLPGHPGQLAALSPDAAIGSSGWTLLGGAALAACAALLAFTAYRPRILEYRVS